MLLWPLLAVGVLVAVWVTRVTKREEPPASMDVTCTVLAFCISIGWMNLIANELVALLQVRTYSPFSSVWSRLIRLFNHRRLVSFWACHRSSSV
jgi:hypothetical protein